VSDLFPSDHKLRIQAVLNGDVTHCTTFVPQGGTSLPQTDGQVHQTKLILGIIPNFRAVSANQVLPPQSAKEKFITATEDSFDHSALLLPAALAGYSMATNATPEFHQGAAGYDRIGSLSCLRKEAKQE
jgi:hypothetical protein